MLKVEKCGWGVKLTPPSFVLGSMFPNRKYSPGAWKLSLKSFKHSFLKWINIGSNFCFSCTAYLYVQVFFLQDIIIITSSFWIGFPHLSRYLEINFGTFERK